MKVIFQIDLNDVFEASVETIKQRINSEGAEALGDLAKTDSFRATLAAVVEANFGGIGETSDEFKKGLAKLIADEMELEMVEVIRDAIQNFFELKK